MEKSIQGIITVRISEDEMYAFIDYKHSDVTTEWSDKKILSLLKDSGITKGYKKFHFSRILNKISESKSDESFLIAKGEEPITTALSKYKICKGEMLPSLEETYNNLSESHKPEVFAIVEDYFLDDTPESLSFIPKNHFYVNEGDIIIRIDMEGKAKNGLTVTGKEIEPAKDSGILRFCISKNLKIDSDKGLIIATKSGFIREGETWLDLIPFKGHKISITPSEDFAEYYMNFTPGSSDSPQPTSKDLIKKFENIDYPLELLKDEKTLNAAILKAINEKKPIKISLTKKKKSKALIDINQTKTKATLILEKGAGPGEQLSLQKIGALIRESNIKGMNLDSLKKVILEFYKSKDLYLEYMILEGKTATRGEPRKLKFMKEFLDLSKIQGVIDRITKDIEAFYPSFKVFTKDDISSAILVTKGLEFAILTDPVPGDDGTDIYGTKIKGLVGNDPIIKTYENISIKQNKYIAEIDGILDLGEVNGETFLRVREHKDMFVDVLISQDAMSACFTFYKSEGSGETASIDFIKKQIEDSGVVKGIDNDVIEESYQKFINGELISEVVFATGVIPSDKKSSRIKYFNNDGQTVFSYEVEKGVNLAQIFPSKEKAEDGYDVLGTVMEASGVINLDVTIGDFILEEKQDDNTIMLVSDINGEVQVKENSITLVDKKVLNGDVSVKTGSIKTLCSLVVKGSVNSSLYVVSGGNIKIMGTVQGALISADKNIIIAQGVKGEEKAVLRAKEKIDVKFIEKANMMAIDDIHIRKAALHTKIISNGKILFDKSGSKVVGGEVFCKKGLTVDEVGSPSGGKTLISFGQDYLVADKIKVFEKDVEKIQEDLMKIEQFFNKPGGHLPQDKITHLRKQKVFLMKKLEKKNMKLFLLREKFEEHSKSEIIVRNKVYPGVVFESHGRKLEILDEEPACKITFNLSTGQIEKTR